MRKIVTLFLALVVLLVAVTPALAQSTEPDGQRNPPKSRTFDLKGQVTAVDTATATLTVKVLRGNDAVKDKIGAEIAILTNSSTVIYNVNDRPRVPLTLADVTVGQTVSVQGVIAAGVFTARQIVLETPQQPPREVPFALVGQVTAVDTAASTLTVMVLAGNDVVKDKINTEVAISVTPTTIIRLYGDEAGAALTLADVTVGQFVSVQGRIVGGVFTARQIITDVPSPQPRPTPFDLIGQVTAVDTTASTLTVKVLEGSDSVKDKIGTEVTIVVTDTTVIRHRGDAPDATITLAEVAVDQYVKVEGHIVADALIARQIITDVGAPRPIMTPFDLVGQITAVDTISSTFTVKVLSGNAAVRDKIGTEIVIQTNAATVFHRFGRPSRTPVTFADLEPLQYVMVNGRIVDGAYVAKLVMIDVPRVRPTL